MHPIQQRIADILLTNVTGPSAQRRVKRASKMLAWQRSDYTMTAAETAATDHIEIADHKQMNPIITAFVPETDVLSAQACT